MVSAAPLLRGPRLHKKKLPRSVWREQHPEDFLLPRPTRPAQSEYRCHSSKLAVVFSQPVGIREMLLMCSPLFDTYEDEKKAANDGERHPQKLARCALETQTTLQDVVAGQQTSRSDGLEVTRLHQYNGKKCEGNPSVSTQEETLLPKEGIPSQEEDQLRETFLESLKGNHTQASRTSDVRIENQLQKRKKKISNWSLGHKQRNETRGKRHPAEKLLQALLAL